jgi:hypothetical protein
MAKKKSDPTPASKKEDTKQAPAPMPKQEARQEAKQEARQEARQEAKQEARQEAKQAIQSGTFGKDDIKALRIADVKPSVIQNLREAAKESSPAPTPAKVTAPAPAKVTAPAPTPVRAAATGPTPMPKQEAKQEAKQAIQLGTFGKDDVKALRAADVKPSVIQNLREAAKESAPARAAATAPTPMPKQEAKQEARQAVESGTFGKDDVRALRDAGVKPEVIQNLRETAKEQSPVQSEEPTGPRTIRDASRLGEAIRIAGEGGITKGELNQITKQFDVSGADVIKRLDIINTKLKDNDLQGIGLNSGAANMLIRQQDNESPTGYEAFLNRQGDSLYGTGKIATELQNRFSRPESEEGSGVVGPSLVTQGEVIRPGGGLAIQGFGKQYEVPERLGGMPKTPDTVTAPTTTPTVDTTTTPTVDTTTTPTVDTTTDLTPPANISSILTPISETETGPATDLSIKGAFSAGGVGNIRLGKQKGKGRKGLSKTRVNPNRSMPKLNNIGMR